MTNNRRLFTAFVTLASYASVATASRPHTRRKTAAKGARRANMGVRAFKGR